MDYYILDSEFNPIEIVQDYKTVIWDERFTTPGVLEIEIISSEVTRSLYRIGTYIGNSLTPRIMVIDEVERTFEDGEHLLKISGVGIEDILKRRTARSSFSILELGENWVFENVTPGNIMRTIFDEICVQGRLNHKDILPHINDVNSPGTLYKPSDILEAGPVEKLELPVASIEETFQTIIETNPGLGYRMYRDPSEGGRLYFDVYSGNDRTLTQSTNDAVVFSIPWGSLDTTSDFDSIREYYNVCYIFGKYGTATVTEGDPTGFDRKVLYLTVTDEYTDNLTGTRLAKYLEQKGREALAEAKRIALFDGEVPKTAMYQYFVDYNLGDLVDLMGEDGNGARMRITGNVTTSDNEGVKSYPTFEMVDHISPDTWSGQIEGQIWETMPGVWSSY